MVRITTENALDDVVSVMSRCIWPACVTSSLGGRRHDLKNRHRIYRENHVVTEFFMIIKQIEPDTDKKSMARAKHNNVIIK